MLETILLYLAVIVLSATPWIEILIVIPFGIGVGLNPVLVGLFAFLGNITPIYLIVAGFERLNTWWARRRGKFLVNPSDETWETGRRARAMNILRKYGVPGMAFVGPLLVGAHISAVIMLLVGAPKYRIVTWMTGSLAFMSIVATIISFYGIGFLTSM